MLLELLRAREAPNVPPVDHNVFDTDDWIPKLVVSCDEKGLEDTGCVLVNEGAIE